MSKLGVYVLNCNYRDFIPFSFKSLMRQTRQPDLLIFVDDASVDDSVAVVEHLEKKFSYKFHDKLLLTENVGTSKANNQAAKYLLDNGCDIFCGISSDDALQPTYLEEAEKLLLSSPADVGYCYSHVRRIGDENQVDVHPEWNEKLLYQMPYIHGSSLIRKEAWLDVGGLPEVDWQEDYEMWKNMARKGWRGVLLAKPLLLWRKHNQFARTYCRNEGAGLRAKKWGAR